MSEFFTLPQDVPKLKLFAIFDMNDDTFVDMGELQVVLTLIHNRMTAPPSPSPSLPPL